MQDDPAGMELLLRLGARSVPVVSVGDRFVFGQNTNDILKLIGMAEEARTQLAPDELVRRIDLVLATAQRLVRQIPDDKLGLKVRNRNRTYLALAHHIFRIPEAFIETAQGMPLTNQSLVAPPSDDIRTSAAVAGYGGVVREKVEAWWAGLADKSGRQEVDTYYGRQPMHDLLERTAWHSAQHVRQIAMMLESHGIVPDRPLTAADTAGLPLPEMVWDD